MYAHSWSDLPWMGVTAAVLGFCWTFGCWLCTTIIHGRKKPAS